MSNISFKDRRYWVTIAALVYAVAEVVLFYPVTRHPFSRFIGVPGDAQQFMWYLGWFWHAVFHGMNPFTSTYINYPHGINLMTNTSIIAESVLFGPFAYVFGVTFVFNTMNMLNLLVIGVISFLIFDELGMRKWIAMFAGLLAILLPFTTAQLAGHTHIVFTSPIFILIYLMIRAIRYGVRRPIGLGVIMGLVIGFEFYTSTEVFATSVLVLAIMLAAWWMLDQSRLYTLAASIPPVVYMVTALSASIILLPGLWMLFFGPYRPLINPTHDPNVFVNDFLNFILPTPMYALHSGVTTNVTSHFSGNSSEDNGYLGLPMLILLVWSVQRMWHRKEIRVIFITFLAIMVLSMGPHLHILGYTTKILLPWIIVEHLPLIQNALPSRIMFYGDILAVVLIIFALDDLVSSQTKMWSQWASLGSLLLISSTWFPVTPFFNTNNPPYQSAISSNGILYATLRGHPTMILTDAFGNVMQSLAAGHYAFPVANVYGFSYDSSADGSYRPYSIDPVIEPLNQQAVDTYIRGMIQNTHVQRILYVDSNNTQIPTKLYNALTIACGNPTAKSGNFIVWATH